MSGAPLTAAERGRLRDLLARPTAPYREAAVKEWATTRLAAAGVPCCEDHHGNIVVGCASLADYRARLRSRDAGPLTVPIAHMDHPGFHGVRWLADDRLAVRWHGGGPRRHLAGARVWLSSDGVAEWPGRLRLPQFNANRTRLVSAEIKVDNPWPGRRPAARRLYGGLAFSAPSWRAGQRIYTRVADDLVGVFAIVESACQRAGRRSRGAAETLGLLTRAEEVGFIGMLAHLDDGWLQQARRPLLAISLEASRNGPGALCGHGPVVRLGDRQSTFSPNGARALERLAAQLLPEAHQRRLMDGGTCEATALLAHGVPAVGLAVPLGNYHNCNLDGGQQSGAVDGPAPEFVDQRDVAGLLALCNGLSSRPWPDDPWSAVRARLARGYRRGRRQLGNL